MFSSYSKNKKKKLNVGLIFSYNSSLDLWKKNGSISREIKPYILLSKNCKIKYKFLTYDKLLKKKNIFKKHFIDIFPVYSKFKYFNNKIIRFLLSFIYPFFIKKYFKDIDVIKTNQMWGSWVGVILKFLLKKPLIIRCGYEIYRNELILNKNITKKIFYKYLSKLTYFYADQILVTTTSIRNFIINNFNISKSKILIQKNWIDTNKFKPSFSNNNLCIYVGRLSEEKNLIDLLNIIKGTKLKLNIYGEGPQKKYLQENIGLNNKQIYMHGTIQNDKLPSVMRKHKIFFLISKYEGQPKSLLEAMSCGLIVIGKNSLGIKDIIRHKKNGYLLKSDYSNLKEISNLIFCKKKNNLKLRNQARKYVLKNHSLHKFLKIENNVYKKVLNVNNF